MCKPTTVDVSNLNFNVERFFFLYELHVIDSLSAFKDCPSPCYNKCAHSLYIACNTPYIYINVMEIAMKGVNI